MDAIEIEQRFGDVTVVISDEPFPLYEVQVWDWRSEEPNLVEFEAPREQLEALRTRLNGLLG